MASATTIDDNAFMGIGKRVTSSASNDGRGFTEASADAEVLSAMPLHYRAAWLMNLAAIVFNTVFGIVAVVTVAGIVFITRPQQVMHDLPPEAWPVLLVIMTPGQLYAIYLAWRTVLNRQMPSAPAIALNQPPVAWWLQPAIALLWLANFVVEFGIVVSLSKPHAANNVGIVPHLVVFVVALWFAFTVNVFLLLAVSTMTDNRVWLDRIWRYRLWLDIGMAVFGVVYYRL